MSFVNYYYKFVPELSEITYLLNQLLKKKKKWKWERRKERNFQQVIKNISKENKIRFYNPKLLFIIETDTLDYIIETTLL